MYRYKVYIIDIYGYFIYLKREFILEVYIPIYKNLKNQFPVSRGPIFDLAYKFINNKKNNLNYYNCLLRSCEISEYFLMKYSF